jgi:hypothetical protein
MSNINATLQSNLVLPVVDSLPASGTVGTQFVYQNNVYVFDSGGLPVRVSPPPATAETFTFTLSGTFSDAGDVTTGNITATKLGNMVVINSTTQLTYDPMGIVGIRLDLSTLPEAIRPPTGSRNVSIFFGNQGEPPYTITFGVIATTGELAVAVNETDVKTVMRITATYFV